MSENLSIKISIHFYIILGFTEVVNRSLLDQCLRRLLLTLIRVGKELRSTNTFLTPIAKNKEGFFTTFNEVENLINTYLAIHL